jgi:hypothetical protein
MCTVQHAGCYCRQRMATLGKFWAGRETTFRDRHCMKHACLHLANSSAGQRLRILAAATRSLALTATRVCRARQQPKKVAAAAAATSGLGGMGLGTSSSTRWLTGCAPIKPSAVAACREDKAGWAIGLARCIRYRAANGQVDLPRCTSRKTDTSGRCCQSARTSEEVSEEVSVGHDLGFIGKP